MTTGRHNVLQPGVIVLDEPEGPERKRAPIPLVSPVIPKLDLKPRDVLRLAS